MSYLLYRDWHPGPELLASLRECFAYVPGENRATGTLYAPADGLGWLPPLAVRGPEMVAGLAAMLGVTFTIAAFQAYRNGAGCGWHADTPFDAQAILSLGVTRTFGIRPLRGDPEWMPVADGDLLFMPSGFQAGHEHCVPVEDAPGERCSIVFRTPA